MKKLLLAILIAALILVPTACAASPVQQNGAPAAASVTSASGQKIKPSDVKKMMDSGDKMTIVDVRTAGEYMSGHLKGAINIPVDTIAGSKPAVLPDLNAVIIVYCQTGVRAAAAAKALVSLGYTKVYDMGGINSWTYETVTATDASASPSASPSPSPSASGGVLSTFTAKDIDGKFVTSSVFKGYKLTMVNIWATFCGPCINEMPELGKLSAALKDQGVQIIGIVADAADSSGEAIPAMVSTAKEIISKTGANYRHLLPSSDLNDLLLDNVSAVPTTIFVDEHGNQVGKTIIGSQSEDQWKSIISGLLKEVG